MKQALLLLTLCWSITIFGQKGEVLLTDFRYIVHDTQEFPNYFDIESLTKEVNTACHNMLRKKLRIMNIDSYQAKEIEYTFRPPFRDNIDLIDKSGYDYYVAITSSVGTNTTSKGERTYVLYMKVQIEDEKGKSIFYNKKEALFKLKYQEEILYDESIVSSQDFKVLYLELLEYTLFKKNAPTLRYFNKPAIRGYKGFLNKADQFRLRHSSTIFNERFYLETDSTSSLLFKYTNKLINTSGALQFSSEHKNYIFLKNFTLRNKQNKQKYKVKGYYEEVLYTNKKKKVITVPELEMIHKEDTAIFTYFPDDDAKWINTLKGKIKDLEFSLASNLYTNHVELQVKGQLIAIIKLPPNDPFKRKQTVYYDFYLKKGLSEEIQVNLANVFALFTMADIFMDDVYRYVSKRDKKAALE